MAVAETNASLYALVSGGVQAFVGSALVNYSLQVAKSLYEASAAAQRLQTTLNYATGGNGAKELEYVRGVANKLGLEFQSTAKAYAQFQAASKGTALEGEKSRAVFESVAKASAVLGLTTADTTGVLLALQQMISKGTVQAEELRGQLGERLPGAFQSAAKAMGVTTAELGKMLEQGQVVADDFLPKFAAQIERDMGGAAEKAADRLDAAVNRFTSAWDQLKQAAGDSGASSFMQKELTALTNDITVVTDAINNLSKTGSGAFAALAGGAGVGAGRAAFGAFNLVVNEFNDAVNAASMGLLNFRTDLNVMPDLFRTNAEQIASMSGELNGAQAKLKRLQELDSMPSNGNYYKSAIEQTRGLISTLQEAINKKRELMSPGSTGALNGAYTEGMGNNAALAAKNEAVRKSEQALADIRAKASGVNKEYAATLRTLQEAKALGTISDKSYLEQVTALAKATWDSSTAGKEEAKSKREAASASKSAESAMRKEQTEYEKLISSINLKILANEEEIKYGHKLSDADRLRFLISEEGTKKLTAAHKENAKARLEDLERSERELQRRKAQIEGDLEYLAVKDQLRKADEERQKAIDRLDESLRSLSQLTQQETDRLALEARLIGASNAQRKIALAQYDLEIEKQKKLKEIRDAAMDDEERASRIAETERVYAQKAANAAGQAYVEEWRATVDQVENIFVSGFADMMNNGKSGWESFCKSLKTSFYTLVAKQIYKMLAEPFVVNIVGNLLGFTAGGAGNAAMQVASGGSGVMNLLSMGKDIFSAITGGFNALSGQVAGYVQSGMNWISGSGGMISQGPIQVGGFASGVGAAAAYGAGALGGIYGGRLIGGGYSLNGGSGNGVINAGTAIGAIFGGPLGALLGGMAGGLVNRLFGRKLKESGIEGEFGGDSGFEGRMFKYYKGGLFRSSKTTYEDMPEEMRKGLGGQFLAMDASIREMAGAVGLGGEALDGFTAKFKVNLKGLSEEEAAKKLQEEFQKIAEQMGGLVLTTEEYTRAGETQLEALARLSTSITMTNEWFKAVGDTLYTVGLAGADMASDLIDAFGGADKFVAVTSNYYDKFFTDQEKVANQTRLLNEQLKKLGVETMPASREEFRKYINSIDVTTEAGQKLYASLLQMADVFDLIYSSAENIAGLKEDLNVQLMRAKGDDEGATRLERDKQLRELEKYKDPELVRLQVEVWAAEDKSKKDAEAKQAADDMAEKLAAAQKAAQDLALKNLEAAISREKEYWNQFSADAKDALSKASSYWTLVTDAAKNLRGSTEDISSWNAAQGMVFIEQAVANARKGLGLSDYDATKSAIDASTAGMTIDKYATQAELDYDKKVLAGQLDELGDFAGLAKSDAQKQIDLATDQIKRLDDTLKFWQDYGKEQVNATLSVTEAVNALYKLLDPKEQERIRKEEAEKAGLTGGSKPPTYTGGGTLGGTVTGSSSGTSIYGYDKDGRALYSDGSIGARPGEYDKSGVSKNASLSEEQWERLKSGQSVYDGYWLGGKQYGLESYYWDEQKQAWLKKGSFAVGTNFVPYDMTANIHQGERIIPAADNRALIAAVQGGGNSLQLAEVVAELRSVKEELQAIKASASISAEQNRKAADVLNQVTDGGNGMRSITMNKVLTVRAS